MILDNRTRYRSADLERVILLALEEAGITSHARDRVLVNHGQRGADYSGWCYFGRVTPPKLISSGRAPRMVLRIPDPAGVKPSPRIVRMVARQCPTHGLPAAPDPSTVLDDPRFPAGSEILRCPRGCSFVRSLFEVPPPRLVPFDVILFGWLVRHEVGHWRGLAHTQMAPVMRWRKVWEAEGRPLPAWCREQVVHLEDAPPAKPSRKPPPDREAEREKRAEHARAMLARAERRAKLAATVVKRWRRRVAAGERAIERAASRAPK